MLAHAALPLLSVALATFVPLHANALDAVSNTEDASARVEVLVHDVETLQALVAQLQQFTERIIACGNQGQHYSTDHGRCLTGTEPGEP